MPRFEHSVLALALACGFVFEVRHLIPVCGVLAGLSALRPSAGPVPRLYLAVVARRLGPPAGLEDPAPWRAAAAVTAGLLGVATLLLGLGDTGLAWAFGLAAAGLCAVTGVGGVCLACRFGEPG